MVLLTRESRSPPVFLNLNQKWLRFFCDLNSKNRRRDIRRIDNRLETVDGNIGNKETRNRETEVICTCYFEVSSRRTAWSFSLDGSGILFCFAWILFWFGIVVEQKRYSGQRDGFWKKAKVLLLLIENLIILFWAF